MKKIGTPGLVLIHGGCFVHANDFDAQVVKPILIQDAATYQVQLYNQVYDRMCGAIVLVYLLTEVQNHLENLLFVPIVLKANAGCKS